MLNAPFQIVMPAKQIVMYVTDDMIPGSWFTDAYMQH